MGCQYFVVTSKTMYLLFCKSKIVVLNLTVRGSKSVRWVHVIEFNNYIPEIYRMCFLLQKLVFGIILPPLEKNNIATTAFASKIFKVFVLTNGCLFSVLEC